MFYDDSCWQQPIMNNLYTTFIKSNIMMVNELATAILTNQQSVIQQVVLRGCFLVTHWLCLLLVVLEHACPGIIFSDSRQANAKANVFTGYQGGAMGMLGLCGAPLCDEGCHVARAVKRHTSQRCEMPVFFARSSRIFLPTCAAK